MKIKYTGPYFKVTAEGISFVRNLGVEVADEDVALRLLGAQIDGVNLFVEDTADVVGVR